MASEMEKMGFVASEAICGARGYSCFCCRPPDHPETNHECECGGQFTGSTDTGDFKAKKLPVRGSDPLFNSIFDGLFGDPD